MKNSRRSRRDRNGKQSHHNRFSNSNFHEGTPLLDVAKTLLSGNDAYYIKIEFKGPSLQWHLETYQTNNEPTGKEKKS